MEEVYQQHLLRKSKVGPSQSLDWVLSPRSGCFVILCDDLKNVRNQIPWKCLISPGRCCNQTKTHIYKHDGSCISQRLYWNSFPDGWGQGSDDNQTITCVDLSGGRRARCSRVTQRQRPLLGSSGASAAGNRSLLAPLFGLPHPSGRTAWGAHLITHTHTETV